jgi:hypothetical protein
MGENVGKTKKLGYLICFLFHGFVFVLWGFNRYKEWIIQLDSKLQVVNGVLRRGDERLKFLFSFKRVSFG